MRDQSVTGLYRYRVGDVLLVAGFKDQAPMFNFVRRKNVALSIDSDKTDEAELHAAVSAAVQHLVPFGASPVEYTSYADTTSTIPGHYVLFWELRAGGTTVPAFVFEDCCLAVEEALNSVYRQGRAADRSIGPLEIRVVSHGTFDKLMDYALARGACARDPSWSCSTEGCRPSTSAPGVPSGAPAASSGAAMESRNHRPRLASCVGLREVGTFSFT
jgi:hypothetical protein